MCLNGGVERLELFWDVGSEGEVAGESPVGTEEWWRIEPEPEPLQHVGSELNWSNPTEVGTGTGTIGLMSSCNDNDGQEVSGSGPDLHPANLAWTGAACTLALGFVMVDDAGTPPKQVVSLHFMLRQTCVVHATDK